MEELNTAMQAGTSQAVQIWMNWMLAVFAASLLFVWRHKPARAVLLAFVLTAITGYIIWLTTRNIHLLGIAHLLIWIPLALFLWKKVLSRKARRDSKRHKIFFLWASLVFATIIISLVFDFRDIFLVLTGGK